MRVARVERAYGFARPGLMTAAPPTRLKLGDDLVLRLLRVSDARAVAHAVRESLEHLKPWMPWADEESTAETFQRQRLRGARHKAAIGDEWQYGLFPRDESSLVGAFGLMARKWPATIEIGYWVHVDDDRPRLRDPGEPRAHQRRRSRSTASRRSASAATKPTCAARPCPARLGFTLVRTETRDAAKRRPRSGRLMIWERNRADRD